MKKTIEVYYCDRCKKLLKKGDVIHSVPYQVWFYDLCEDCFGQLKELKNKVNELKHNWEELEKEYKFGEYLPKEIDEEN